MLYWVFSVKPDLAVPHFSDSVLDIGRQDDVTPNWFAGKRVLITGGGGFIGSNLTALLCRTGCHITRVLRHPSGSVPPEYTRVHDLIGNVNNASLWHSLPDGFDVVFHLAAQTSAYEANRNPRADLESNVLPMLMMLQACQQRNLNPIVVCAGTATACGLPSRLPVDESLVDAPVTIYDLHKQMAENYLKYFARTGDVRGSILRLANVYGPGPLSSRADRGVLNQMVGKALRGEPLTVYGDGEQIRDYVYVEDVARAFLAAPAHIDRLNGQHFLIGRGEGHSIANALDLVAQRVAEKTGVRVPVISVEPPSGLSVIEARNFVADTRSFTEQTGWSAAHPLADGIDRIIESLL